MQVQISSHSRSRNNNRNQLLPHWSCLQRLSFYQRMDGTCHCCGKKGHLSAQCWKRNSTPEAEWHITKEKKTAQAADRSAQASLLNSSVTEPPQSVSTPPAPSGAASTTSSVSGWANVQFDFQFTVHKLDRGDKQFFGGHEMPDVFLLDNQSSVSLFCNPEYLHDIHVVAQPITLGTNGGDLVLNKKGTLPGYGEVWYEPNAITNIISFAELREKYQDVDDEKVSYDYKKNEFVVHDVCGKDAKFVRSEKNLYYFTPSKNAKIAGVCAPQTTVGMDTVEENMAFYTPRQVEAARKARELYHVLLRPSIEDFKYQVSMNLIGNCPVTVEDIDRAMVIYGPDIGLLKGMTHRGPSAPVQDDYISIPKELLKRNQKEDLHIDGLTINGVPFLTSVSRNIKYRMALPLKSKEPKSIWKALTSMIRHFNKAGIKLATVYGDQEFQVLRDKIDALPGMKFNPANAQEHEPRAERNNQHLKNRFRAVFHCLPFNRFPRVMVQVLGSECARKANWFCPGEGISQIYSPHAVLNRRKIDYAKHCQVPFGAYVQAHNEPDPLNSMLPRTLDCIYLRTVHSQQGGHELLNLRTGKVVNRRKVTKLPTTQAVIDLVHALADQDGMSQGLKVEIGQALFSSTPLLLQEWTKRKLR